MSRKRFLPALNIRRPWGGLIIEGKKTIETRGYPIPLKYLGQEILLVETPGTDKAEKARILGVAIFDSCFQYRNREAWLMDRPRHLVGPDDPQFAFSVDKPKWGWNVRAVKRFPKEMGTKVRRGIIFTRAVPVPSIMANSSIPPTA